MLIRADPQQNTLSLLSFPRDLNVPIYCNTTSSLVVDRINSAWSRCGPQGTLDTVQKLTGIPVNYLITLDFHGFKLIVNKLHGVYMNVDHRYINTQGGTCSSCYATIDLHPGYQKLDGQEALDFVRSRHTDNDIYRNARQQLFLESLKDRLASGFSLFDIPQLIGALKHNLEIARGGSTGTPSMSEIQSYVGLGYHLKPNHLFRVTINNLVDCGAFAAQLCTQPSDIQAAVDSFMHPDVSLPARANNAALGRKPTAPKQPVIKRSEISTLVLNGTPRGRARARDVVQARRRGLSHGAAAAGDVRQHAAGHADLHLELRLLRPGAGACKRGCEPVEGGDGPEHARRRAAARACAPRAAGGESARGRRCRHRVRRRDRQSAGAHRPGDAAPAAERAKRCRRDARAGSADSRESARSRSWCRM